MNAHSAATQITQIAAEVARDNAAAITHKQKDAYNDLHWMVSEHGIANVVSMLAGICADREAATQNDDHCAEYDWLLANQVMEMAAGGVDLLYGARGAIIQIRHNAIQFVKEHAAKLPAN